MSHHGPSTPPEPPGRPHPDPDHHRLARRSVRWTIVGVVISTALALIGLYVDAARSDHGGSGPGTTTGGTTTSGGPSADPGGTDGGGSTVAGGTDSAGADGGGTSRSGGTSDGGTASEGGTSGSGAASGTSRPDGPTAAEHDLRDSLNSDQWSRDSCTRALWPGSDAALFCTVTTTDAYGTAYTGKASVVTYATKSARDAVFQRYASRVQMGDCETQTDVYGSWAENDSPDRAAGDVVCYLATSGQYVFLCSYYDRPALVQITGPDRAGLTAWWHTMEPVFSD
ncbi:hypothetical protein ACIBBD_26730 [Streptomyces sp. NPDC051315]|uniref:hypothetical protein n=1 Tax=Streptomyces sp. NPDC051315 TaxID=3365650 RepID=UPI003796F633